MRLGARSSGFRPRALACDVRRDRLWIINDPDSVRGNYRARDEETASGHYADYVPLLFEMKLSRVMDPAAGKAAANDRG